MVYQLGTLAVQNSTMSVVSFKDGSGPKAKVFWPWNSLRESFCTVPRSSSQAMPRFRETDSSMLSSTMAGWLMVSEMLTWSKGMSWKRSSMSLTESMATPSRPTSPSANSWSES